MRQKTTRTRTCWDSQHANWWRRLLAQAVGESRGGGRLERAGAGERQPEPRESPGKKGSTATSEASAGVSSPFGEEAAQTSRPPSRARREGRARPASLVGRVAHRGVDALLRLLAGRQDPGGDVHSSPAVHRGLLSRARCSMLHFRSRSFVYKQISTRICVFERCSLPRGLESRPCGPQSTAVCLSFCFP